MHCLTCAQHRQRISRDAICHAVAACVLCGAGACLEHVRTYDVTTYSLQPGGMVPVRRPDPQPLRVYLCPRCADLVCGDPDAARLLDRARELERLRGVARPIPEPVV